MSNQTLNKQTIKAVLNQNHKKKNKDELVKLLQGIEGVVGSDYYDITGVQPKELSKITNKELLDIIEDFKENYSKDWENGMSDAPTKVLKMIFDQMTSDESFSVQNVADGNFTAELASIEFDKLIGGALDACVTAQTNASVATVNFIKEVGFDDDDEIRMVDFTHKKMTPNPNFESTDPDLPPGTNTTDELLEETVSLEVPFISLLNVPSFRIENCTIDFNVKLNSVYSKDVSNEFGLDASVKGGWGPVKFKVSASYKRSSSTGIKVEKQYTMGVKVVATNDEMPAGLDRVLGILSE